METERLDRRALAIGLAVGGAVAGLGLLAIRWPMPGVAVLAGLVAYGAARQIPP